MADKYTIQIQPQINSSDAKKMEEDLNKRFTDVAKKFGSHLGGAIKSVAKAGLATISAGIASTVLSNPFDKINEDINLLLEKFDNTATRAGEFGVSSGKFYRAESIAASAGVKDFEMIIGRFSSALESARTREDDYLKNFLGAKDIIDAFYSFSNTLRQMPETERNAAVDKVFGGKMGLRIAELLQTDLAKRSKQIFGKTSDKKLTDQIDYIASLEDIQAIAAQQRALLELFKKGSAISPKTIYSQNQYEKEKQNLDVTNIGRYDELAKFSITQEKLLDEATKMTSGIVDKLVPRVEKLGQDFGVVSEWFSDKMTNVKTKINKEFFE